MSPAPPLDLIALFDPRRVVIFPGTPAKAIVIAALAESTTEDLGVHERLAFIRAVLDREEVASTAIGGGIAIPHARSPDIPACRLAVGVLPSGVPWGAADGQPVRLALLIAARESDHAEHLRVMAALAVRLHRPGLADAVCVLRDHAAIVRAIAG
ncbi:MAG: PTS sugar transporter subunit IIA [Planctomycetota bacterium]|nr:PTS sugar transporter subunit IIA [Planctomycetota bacterium]MCX8040286.1 PTS sugar transporter subunit IIA [Planctomycetota bacterium]MDW8372419.1 PTS sugar transporter subunit IIA [Planctomycetota bacterium]